MIIYKFIKNTYLHIKYTRLLNSIYKKENLLKNLSGLFHSNFKLDWVGRIYTVINPYLINKEYDGNNIVYEMDDNGINSNAFIEQYVMEKLIIAQRFVYANNLFDLLTYDIKKIDNNGNCLFIMKPITFDDFIKSFKHFLILLGIVSIMCIMIILFLNLNIF